jgi:hypothetical protein
MLEVGSLRKFEDGFLRGFKEGFIEGFKEGWRIGVTETTTDIDRRMLAKKYPAEEIASYTGLSVPEIKKLKN